MDVKKFQGTKMVVLCALYLFAVQGFLSVWTIPYGAYWSDFYGTTMTPLGFGPTVMGVVGIIAGFTSIDAIITRFGAKTMLIIDTICVLAVALIWGFIPQLWAYYLGWCFVAILTISMFATATHIIVQWFYLKRQRMIGYAVGFSSFGMFVFQYIAAYAFPNFGLTGGFLLIGGLSGGVALVCSLLIKESPAMVGQHALGYEDDPERTLVADMNKTTPEKKTKADKSLSRLLLSTPSFIMLLIAFLFMANGPSVINSYASMYLPALGGFTVTEAATFMSLLALGNAILLTFVLGPMVNKFHAKKVLIFCGACTILGFAAMLVYTNGFPSMGVLVVMFFTYIVGFSMSNLSNYIAPDLYGTELSTVANVKFQTITKCSSLWVAPVTAALIDGSGLGSMTLVVGVIFVIGFAIAMVAFGIFRKRDSKILAEAVDMEESALAAAAE